MGSWSRRMSFDPLTCSEAECAQMLQGYLDSIANRPVASSAMPYLWGYVTACREPTDQRETIGAIYARLQK
jgi:hypothetical protein